MAPEEFARKIEQWRKTNKLYQKEAAAVFDVPTGTYRTWEKGSRTPSKLALAEIERRMDGFKIKVDPLKPWNTGHMDYVCQVCGHRWFCPSSGGDCPRCGKHFDGLPDYGEDED